MRLSMFVLILFFSAIGAFAQTTKGLLIMFYNVENLFDIEHQSGKEDWIFTPKKMVSKAMSCRNYSNPIERNLCLEVDWSQKKLDVKTKNLAEIISNRGKQFPDILGLCEVENTKALSGLAKRLGYEKFIVADGPDRRGINVALMYRNEPYLKVVRVQEHLVPGTFFLLYPKRSILEVEFLVMDKYSLIVFVNHWPSQANAAKYRVLTANRLREIAKKHLMRKPRPSIFFMGDFNTVEEDDPHPFRDVLLNERSFFDLHSTYLRNKRVSQADKNKMPPGTYFFSSGMKWIVFDRFFGSADLFRRKKQGLHIDIKSYTIFAPDWATTQYKYSESSYLKGSLINGIPASFPIDSSLADAAGYSDHFPIMVRLLVD